MFHKLLGPQFVLNSFCIFVKSGNNVSTPEKKLLGSLRLYNRHNPCPCSRPANAAVCLPLVSGQEKSRKMQRLIKNACNCLLSIAQALELKIHTSNEVWFSDQHLTAVLSICLLISGVQYIVICSPLVSFVLQNRSRTIRIPNFSWPYRHHQAYVAVSCDLHGSSALLTGLWTL